MTRNSTNSGLLLGYDARYERNTGLLNEVLYRQNYLFKEDVLDLSSVDTAIWPSVFDEDNQPTPSKRPSYVGPVQDLWSDMKLMLASLPCSRDVLAIIAFKVIITKRSKAHLAEWKRRVESIDSSQEPSSWKLLGYDVADRYLTSSLFDCGLGKRKQEIILEGSPVSMHLNDRHLFVSHKCADKFALISENIVKEHAPFFTYAVWQASFENSEV